MCKGRVTSLADFGAFVDIGGIDGLVHLSELSWTHVAHPSEVLSVGDNVEVYILKVELDEQRVALSLKRLEPEPWTEVFDHYQIEKQVVRSMPVVELIMGDRLLVWIVDGAKISDPGQTLPELLEAGLSKRKGRGLNRFRLVVVGDFLSWEKRWAHLAEGLDPKVHLHALPSLTEPMNHS